MIVGLGLEAQRSIESPRNGNLSKIVKKATAAGLLPGLSIMVVFACGSKAEPRPSPGPTRSYCLAKQESQQRLTNDAIMPPAKGIFVESLILEGNPRIPVLQVIDNSDSISPHVEILPNAKDVYPQYIEPGETLVIPVTADPNGNTEEIRISPTGEIDSKDNAVIVAISRRLCSPSR